MAEFDKFRDFVEAAAAAELDNRQFEEYREKIKVLEEKAAIEKRETGVDSQPVDKDSKEYKAAKAAKARYDFYVKETAEKVRGNLEGILADADPSKLATALRFVPAKSEKYQDLAGLIADYQMYATLKDGPIGRDEESATKNSQDAGKRFEKGLEKAIQQEMQAKGTPEAKAKINAEYLAIVADARYQKKVVDEQYKKAVEAIQGRTGEIAMYLRDALKEDKDYINFAKALYAAHMEKKDGKLVDPDKKDKPIIVNFPQQVYKMRDAA